MTVQLSQEVLMQVLRYNVSVGARFLLITNGSFTYGFEIVEGNFTALTAIEQI
jgi:predicted type IV restriction endonuclease